ncbi:outer membrane protein assembly factor BamA [Desulforhabdus amnigena]|uniref:Outer membrane protein assembly factor BamA n=1 Tax=Desulforhabdus amnigena TaxID=40218 RepID=A0A9W6L8R7_9BACT|nr:outer membrane protein assembly factor BamA [Desulforhabdus amnigena]NLJ26787.1 outer membrane protein assembly factor BamA [Deltaproteobacteria bacterium]GLI35952.1 OMP85 family outer membrane protein [Desulforhabdus amnigena]
MRKLWMILCLIGMSSISWAQDSTPSVALLPFTIHSKQDTVKTQKTIIDLLVRQLNAEGVKTVDPQEVEKIVRPGESVQMEDQARSIGRRLSAGYVVTGSLNEIGNNISLDAKLIDVSGAKKTEPLFAEEKGMENLAAAINQIIQQMAVHLLAKAVIADVKIQGNERIEAEAIKLNIKSKKGELLRSEQVAEDIKAIYKMGYFEKVDVEVTDTSAGKVLTFVLQENPTVQEVRIKGNKKIKEKDILAAIGTRQYTILQKNVVAEDVQKILKLYSQKGYYNADVKTQIEFPKDPRKATVVFDIDEKNKVYIKKISFTGNKSFSGRKLRGIMQTKQKSVLSWVTDRGILQKDIMETDTDRLTVFYHDKGFMDAKVGTPEITRRDDGFYINIPIDEGERYKVTSVKVSGDLIKDEEKIKEDLKSKSGEYFSREKLREDIDFLSKSYMNEGYAYVQVDPEVKRNAEDQTADITYNIKKGELVHIGRIYITGNTKTRDKVIRREMKLAEGDTFNSTKMEESMTNLKKLDYFEDVEITPSRGEQSDIMNLNVKVKEKLTGAISVGGGFSSDDGLFASGEIMQRNLFGRGQSLGFKAYLGQDASRYVASFTEPWLFDRHIIAGIDVYDWLREYNDFTKDAIGFRIRTGYPFGNYSRLNTYYTFEDADVTDVADTASVYIKSQEGRRIKSSITMGVERDTTNHPFLPTKGTINAVSMEFSSQYLGSDSDFIKSEVHSGWYFPIYWKLVGFVRGEFGYIDETDPDNPVPIYERFFLGGINSLRAFDWGDVGPKDEQGEVIGGLTYGVANFEVLFPLIEKLGVRGVVFFDAGNAYNDIDEFDVSNFRTDAGAGIRWNSPFGPLRIEWGYNLDPEPGEDNSKWQFSAGAFF